MHSLIYFPFLLSQPTDNPTAPPTDVPTTWPTVRTGGPVVAAFDSTLDAPKRSAVGTSCTASELLLEGKSNNKEPNGSNTLDSCADGYRGSYHGDESIDTITVSAVGGGNLQAGGLAEIEAKVWAWSDGAYDVADFYYTASVDNAPTWVYINSLPANGPGLRTLKLEYTLPESPIQAVRVNFRYGGVQDSCTGGAYDDVDDLVFSVAPATDGRVEVRKAKPVPPLKSMQTSHCTMIGERNRCDEASVCVWQNGENKGGGKGGGKRGGSQNQSNPSSGCFPKN